MQKLQVGHDDDDDDDNFKMLDLSIFHIAQINACIKDNIIFGTYAVCANSVGDDLKTNNIHCSLLSIAFYWVYQKKIQAKNFESCAFYFYSLK